MLLSKILYPRDNVCNEDELYIKGFGYQVNNKCLKLDKNSKVSYLTYFNSFSVEKWKNYTMLENLNLRIRAVGRFKLSIINVYSENGDIVKNICQTEEFNLSEESDITLGLNIDYKGIVGFEIETSDYTCELVDCEYNTSIAKENLNYVKLAIGICTFKREEYIIPNLQRLKAAIDNSSSLLHNRVDIYVSDNGKTLDIEKLSSEHIKIAYNENYGGASGFTRSMIEAYKSNAKERYSNFTFLDDDIVLAEETIEKLLSFLMMLKQEYKNSMIGGAMFSLDHKWLQFENGADFVKGNFVFNNRNLDMRRLKNIVINETPARMSYNAWCFCTIPFNVINDHNLPLPVFFHMDDVEYGLRNKLKVITLNGLNVWHLYKRFMPNPKNDYYDVRNKLIMLSELSPSEVWHVINGYMRYYITQTIKYHYAQAINGFNGIIDYLKGFEYFKVTNAGKIHKSLYNNISWENATEDIIQKAKFGNSDIGLQKDDIKCLIKKSLGKSKKAINVIYRDNSMTESIEYKKVYVVHPTELKYAKYTKSLTLAFVCFRKYLKIKKILKNKFTDILNEWTNRINELKTFDFWKKYLGIEIEQEYTKRVLLVASDNNITSGAFRSMATLAKLLRNEFKVYVTVMLPHKGDGQELLQTYNVPFTTINSSDWIVRDDISESDLKRKKKEIKDLNGIAVKKIKEYIIDNKIDIVHINTSYHYVAAIAAKQAKVPIIWHIREFLEEDQKRHMLNKSYGYSLMKKSNAIVAISDSIASKYRKLLIPNKVIKIYNGIDDSVFCDESREIFKDDVITLIAAGTITEYKGQHLVIEAIGKLKVNKNINNIQLLLVGNNVGEYMRKIYDVIKQYELSDSVKILGARKDIDKLYKQADIACVCSISEAFGRVTVESMMSGCLTIGANTAGTKEILIDGYSGYLFESGNSDDLAEKLYNSIMNKNESRKIAKQGREYAVENFSASTNAKNIYDLYNSINKEN